MGGKFGLSEVLFVEVFESIQKDVFVFAFGYQLIEQIKSEVGRFLQTSEGSLVAANAQQSLLFFLRLANEEQLSVGCRDNWRFGTEKVLLNLLEMDGNLHVKALLIDIYIIKNGLDKIRG
jgi:hypothetical protein